MLVEGRRLGLPYPWLVAFVVAGALVAISVAFPLFLALRHVRMAGSAGTGP
jgi:hypothetical protein